MFGVTGMAGEDIRRRTYEFARRIVILSRHLERQGSVSRTLGLQVLRSGTFIGANLEEAGAGHSRADFVARCMIALKEARETHYWLRLLADTETVNPTDLAGLLGEADELVAVLTRIVKNSKQ